MKRSLVILAVTAGLAGVTILPCAASDGGYDASWQNGGRELVSIVTNADARLRDMVVQPDGKLVLAGDCDAGGATYDCMARLLPDGSLDLTFGPYATGRFTFQDYPEDYPPYGVLGRHGLLRQPDGRFIIAGHGEFNGVSGIEEAATVARLGADGHLELDDGNTYTPVNFVYNPSQAGGWIEAAALQPDGKIVVAGATNRPNANPVNRDCAVARLNPDRSQDYTFGSGYNGTLVAFDLGGGNDDYCEDVAVQRDGRIVVVGYTEIAVDATSVKDVAVARLNPDGSYDNTFGNAGRLWFSAYGGARDSIAYAVKIDRQDRIVIAGLAQYGGDDHDFFVTRLLPGGALDTSFNGGSSLVDFGVTPTSDDVAYDLALQSDGKIVAAGAASYTASSNVFAVARINADGTLDGTFGDSGRSYGSFSPGTAYGDSAATVAIGPGGLFVAGPGAAGSAAGSLDFGIARLTLDLIFTDGFQ